MARTAAAFGVSWPTFPLEAQCLLQHFALPQPCISWKKYRSMSFFAEIRFRSCSSLVNAAPERVRRRLEAAADGEPAADEVFLVAADDEEEDGAEVEVEEEQDGDGFGRLFIFVTFGSSFMHGDGDSSSILDSSSDWGWSCAEFIKAVYSQSNQLSFGLPAHRTAMTVDDDDDVVLFGGTYGNARIVAALHAPLHTAKKKVAGFVCLADADACVNNRIK